MKRLRLAAALLCALLVLAVPAMADGFGMGDFDSDTVNKNPQVDNPNEVTPTPSTEPPQESVGDSTANNAGDAVGTDGAGKESSGSSSWDDDIWNWSANGSPNVAPPSEAQQELEEARRQQGGRCRPHRTGTAPAGSENRQPGAVHPHRGAAGRGPLHCHLPVYPPGAGGRPRR